MVAAWDDTTITEFHDFCNSNSILDPGLRTGPTALGSSDKKEICASSGEWMSDDELLIPSATAFVVMPMVSEPPELPLPTKPLLLLTETESSRAIPLLLTESQLLPTRMQSSLAVPLLSNEQEPSSKRLLQFGELLSGESPARLVLLHVPLPTTVLMMEALVESPYATMVQPATELPPAPLPPAEPPPPNPSLSAMTLQIRRAQKAELLRTVMRRLGKDMVDEVVRVLLYERIYELHELAYYLRWQEFEDLWVPVSNEAGEQESWLITEPSVVFLRQI